MFVSISFFVSITRRVQFAATIFYVSKLFADYYSIETTDDMSTIEKL